MSRSQQVIDDTAAQRIVEAALACLHERGLAATTMRDVAARAGVPVARVYDQHRSKQALLFEIMDATHDSLIAQTLAAQADAPDAPDAQLDAVMWALSDFHARHPRECLVAQREVPGMADPCRRRIAAKRGRLLAILTAILEDGVRRGCFTTTEPAAVARSLLMMVAAIPSWYDPTNLQTPRAIARTYRELGARMAGLRTAEPAPPGAALVARLTMGEAA